MGNSFICDARPRALCYAQELWVHIELLIRKTLVPLQTQLFSLVLIHSNSPCFPASSALPPASNSFPDFPLTTCDKINLIHVNNKLAGSATPMICKAKWRWEIWTGSIKPSGPVILNYSFVLQRGASFESPAQFPLQTALSPCLPRLQLF